MFLLRREWHCSIPTLQVLHKRGISATSLCQRCGQQEGSFLHCAREHSYIVPGSALSLYSCGKLWIFLILISSLQGLHGTGLGRDALARTLTSSLLVCGGLGDPETLCALRRNLPIRTWCFGRLETWRP